MIKRILFAVAFAVLFYVVGWNVGWRCGYPQNVWPIDRGGLKDLDNYMKKDSGERMALMAITDSGNVYLTQSVPVEDFEFRAVVVDKRRSKK